MNLTLHRAPVLLPVSGPPIADGAIAVHDGRIHAVGRHDELNSELSGEPGLERIEWAGAIIPGLVNAHTHLQYTDMAAVGRGSYDGFEDWSRSFLAAYGTEHDWAQSAAAGTALALQSGTTTIADVVTNSDARSALHDAGLHGITFWEVFAWRTSHWRAEGATFLEERLAAIPTPPAAGLSPHAVYSLGTEVLRDLSARASNLGVRLHIHAAESRFEDEFTITGSGTLADQWRDRGYPDFELLAAGGSGLRTIEYLDSVGALTAATHLAHGIYVDADDRELLRRRRVAVALCPRSNSVIGLDAPPLAAYLREGNAIAVGTDSLSSSPSLNVLDDVAALYRIAREQGYHSADLHHRLLEAATLGGARALGLADGPHASGALTGGARADLAVVDVTSTVPEDALAELVETGSTPVTATIVGGEKRWSARALAGREAKNA